MSVGLNEPAALRIMATTYKDGDPGFVGVLAGVALGIPSYHILELKDQVPDDVWSAQLGMKELELEPHEVDLILKTMREARGETSA